MAYFVTEFFGDSNPDNRKLGPFPSYEEAEACVVATGYWLVYWKGKSKMIGNKDTWHNPEQKDRLAEILEE